MSKHTPRYRGAGSPGGLGVMAAIYGAVLAFLGRGLALIGLTVVASGMIWGALALHDNYWTPILLEVAVGCGLVAVLQVVPGRQISVRERVGLIAATLGLLYMARVAPSESAWRPLLIEFGCGVGLFIALDRFVVEHLTRMEEREHGAFVEHYAEFLLFMQIANARIEPRAPEEILRNGEEFEAREKEKPAAPYMFDWPPPTPTHASGTDYALTALPPVLLNGLQRPYASPFFDGKAIDSLDAYEVLSANPLVASAIHSGQEPSNHPWLNTLSPAQRSFLTAPSERRKIVVTSFFDTLGPEERQACGDVYRQAAAQSGIVYTPRTLDPVDKGKEPEA